MSPITFVASKCCQFLIGKALCEEVIREAMGVLAEELKLPEGVPGGQSQYRVTLSASFLWRSYVRLCLELQASLEVFFFFPSLPPSLLDLCAVAVVGFWIVLVSSPSSVCSIRRTISI
jgi:hypothetical protein